MCRPYPSCGTQRTNDSGRYKAELLHQPHAGVGDIKPLLSRLGLADEGDADALDSRWCASGAGGVTDGTNGSIRRAPDLGVRHPSTTQALGQGPRGGGQMTAMGHLQT